MSFVVISSSLNPKSRSRALARKVHAAFEASGCPATFVDLNEETLPLCDGGACYADERVIALQQIMANAEGILMAMPIYNFTINAAAKNMVELMGRAWTGKVVGFVCAAGGASSYMSVMSTANSLMLDFRAVIVPRFVYVHDGDFDGDRLVNPSVDQRLEELTATMIRFTRALNPLPQDTP